MPSLVIDSPLGPLTILERDGAIVSVEFGDASRDDPSPDPPTPLLRRTAKQLAEYFARKRTAFDLPLAPRGSEFQRALWRLLEGIPYGEVRTYGQLAAELKSVPRAVGGACGANPIPIIIPCHRVVGGSQLGGYSGGDGRATKERLLALERADLFHSLA
jgi:methylated-DNA-[protein]-cysteine S-methyltransferase